jgi:hypothetical protein
MKIRKSLLTCALVTFLLASCAPAITYNFKPATKIDTLNLSLQSTTMVPTTVMEGFDSTLQAFIDKYNSEVHPFKLTRVSDVTNNTIRINVLETKFVSSDKQTAGAVLSIMGLAMPFIMVAAEAPFFVFFYYFPQVVSLTEITFSPDMGNVPPEFAFRQYPSPGFLKSIEAQKSTHINRFGTTYLRQLMLDLERSYKMTSTN